MASVVSPRDLSELLTMLLGREATVRPAAAPWNTGEAAVFGTYLSEDGDWTGVFAADLPGAVATGAALSLLPATVAAKAIENGSAPPQVMDNVHEVMNVVASLLNRPGRVHCRLHDVGPPQTTDEVVAGILGAPTCERLDLEVAVEGYGTGRILLATI